MSHSQVDWATATRAIEEHNRATGTAFVVIRLLSASTSASPDAVFQCQEPCGQQAALRLSLGQDLKAVAAHQERARTGGVRAPPVLSVGCVGDHGYLLTRWTEGAPRKRLPGPAMRELVNAIGRMRNRATPVPGRWTRFLQERAYTLAGRIRRQTTGRSGRDGHPGRVVTLAGGLVDHVRQIKDLPVRECDLVHGDLHAANVLVRRRRLAAVIDWELAGVGDHRFDLASLDVWRVATTTGRLPQRWSVPATDVATAAVRIYQALATLSLLSWSSRSREPHLHRRVSAIAGALIASRSATT